MKDSTWIPLNEASIRLRKIFLELLDDWGAFLQIAFYREAIIHFFGGAELVLQRIPVFDEMLKSGVIKFV